MSTKFNNKKKISMFEITKKNSECLKSATKKLKLSRKLKRNKNSDLKVTTTKKSLYQENSEIKIDNKK